MRHWLTRHSKAVAATALALFCALLGVVLLDPSSTPGSKLVRVSYDSYFSLLSLNAPPPTNSPVVLVYLDIESHQNQHQDPTQPWPRDLYAQLILRLKSAGARVVVFDVVFDSLGTNVAANAALRDAIASHGRVVLAGELRALSSDSGVGDWGRAIKTIEPIEEFRRVAAGWGLGEVATDEDFVVRRYYTPAPDRNEPFSNLTLTAARVFGLDNSQITNGPSRIRWLQYYGPPFSLPHRSFSQVLKPGDVNDAEFQDKIVFVGARPIAGLFKERRDEFRSPFHLWGEKDLFMPGVEVHATEMHNLMRDDWLWRPGSRALGGWFALAGVLLGAGLLRLRPVSAAITAAIAVGAVTASSAVLFRQSHVWQNIAVSAQVAADLWPVRGNATQLHQVLLNLCINARDAMPDGGSLSLAADNVELSEAEACAIPDARRGEFVVFIVSDTGAGIPPDVLPKVFEPFFTTKSEGQGTGLGLSTTARIVKTHDGFVALQSQPGAGTTFEIYLPRFVDVVTNAAATDTSAPPCGHGELILVADDDEAVRELLRRSLEDYGYRVTTAANGAEAVSLFKQQPRDVALLISDQSMPVMDGFQAVAAMRAMRVDLPVLFLTGDGEARTMQGESSQRQVEYLSKPIELDQLLRAVNGVLANSGKR